MPTELFTKDVVAGVTYADLYGVPASETYNSYATNNNTLVNPTIYGGTLDGATYQSSISGARVEIFPDPNTGISIWNNEATPYEVFEVLVGGTNVGDVTMGNFAGGAAYAQWDQSLGTFTVAGTIIATSGFIGGWTIIAGYLYDLTSGTPTAAPNNGVVMDSGNAALIIYESTAERVRVGYLSAAVYGIRVYATDGSTVIFEASDTRQTLAGWTYSDTRISIGSGAATVGFDATVTGGDDVRIFCGSATPTTAPFRVTEAGVLTATSGTVGGWNLTTTVLRTGATDAASNVLIDSANSLMRLGPTTGDFITIDGANQRIRSSTYATGVSGFTVEPTLVEAQNIIARGTLSGSVFRYDVISATGGRQVIANADALSTAMTALDASTLTVRGNATFAVNDILVIRAQSSGGIQEEYLRVTAIGAAPTYTVTRDLLGTYAADTNPAWAAGTAVVQHGESDGAAAFSGGWLDLVGEASAGNFPRISVFSRTGVAATAFTERVRMGNLNGYVGYASDIYGFACGTSAGTDANITIDPTNGIRIRQGTTNRITFDTAGTATMFNLNVEGSLNVFTSGNIRSGQTAYNTGTGWFLEYNAATPRFSLGNPAGAFMTWDGTDLTISGGLVMSAGTGTVSINQSATTGSSLSVVRNLASASTDSPVVFFRNQNAGDDQAVLSVQQDAVATALIVTQNTNSSALGITSVNTTTNTFAITASSLTTGDGAVVYSNSADASARRLLRVTNDNAAATGTIAALIQQDAAGIGLQISQDGNANALFIPAQNTTANIINAVGDSLTTGGIGRFYSNSASVAVRDLVSIINDNVLAAGARCLFIDQDADANYLRVDAENTTSSGMFIECDVLTSGNCANFNSSSTSATARTLVNIANFSALATAARCLTLDQDANALAFYVDSEATSAHILDAEADTLTTGNWLNCDNADALTSGRIFYGYSNSTSTTARNLSEWVNDNTAANRTIPIRIQQDALWFGAYLDGLISMNDPYVLETPVFTASPNDGMTQTPGAGTITRRLVENDLDTGGGGDTNITSTGCFTPNGSPNGWDVSWVLVIPNIRNDSGTIRDVYVGLDSAAGVTTPQNISSAGRTARHVAVGIEDGVPYATNANGTTQTITSIAGSWTVTTAVTLAIVYRAATDITFLVKTQAATTWTVAATHTTNIPSGGTDAPELFFGVSTAAANATRFGNPQLFKLP